MKVEFHPESAREAMAAKEWYSQINDDLGQSFANELESGIEKILRAPNRWSKHHHGTHAFLIHRFPYLIVYRVIDKKVQVVAVQHAKRHPEYWTERV